MYSHRHLAFYINLRPNFTLTGPAKNSTIRVGDTLETINGRELDQIGGFVLLDKVSERMYVLECCVSFLYIDK
jgi:hypothetical protein